MGGRAGPGTARGSRPADGPSGLTQWFTTVNAVSIPQKRLAVPMVDEAVFLAFAHGAHPGPGFAGILSVVFLVLQRRQ